MIQQSLKQSIFFFLLLIGISFSVISQDNQLFKEIPFRIYPTIGLGVPEGGSRKDFNDSKIHYGFNVISTHNPTITFGLGAETPWNNNWFLMDSLWVGLKISTQKFSTKDVRYNERIRLSTAYITLSRSFWIKSFNPYLRIGIGASTMNTSPYNNFVFSGGASLSTGFYTKIKGYDFGFELGYNAPLIAYRNILTGFFELNIAYILNYNIKAKVKEIEAPSFKY